MAEPESPIRLPHDQPRATTVDESPVDPVQEASEESFPASDAPSRTVVIGVDLRPVGSEKTADLIE